MMFVPNASPARLWAQDILHAGDEVELRADGPRLGPRIMAKVTGVQEDQLQLELADISPANLPAPGTTLHLTKVQDENLYYLQGALASARGKGEARILTFPGFILWSQRRQFPRFNLNKTFRLEEVVLPDGAPAPACKGVLMDMSLDGIGFRTAEQLPSGTVFKARELIHPLLPGMQDVVYAFRVIWSRGNRWFGFRVGAGFAYPDAAEETRVIEVLRRLQIDRLSWFYRKFRQEPTDHRKPGVGRN